MVEEVLETATIPVVAVVAVVTREAMVTMGITDITVVAGAPLIRECFKRTSLAWAMAMGR